MCIVVKYTDNALTIIHIYATGMNCNDDIEENHLGAGNEKKRDCPRRYDSVCKVPLKDAPGSVTFVCKHGFWLIPTGNYTIC